MRTLFRHDLVGDSGYTQKQKFAQDANPFRVRSTLALADGKIAIYDNSKTEHDEILGYVEAHAAGSDQSHAFAGITKGAIDALGEGVVVVGRVQVDITGTVAVRDPITLDPTNAEHFIKFVAGTHNQILGIALEGVTDAMCWVFLYRRPERY